MWFRRAIERRARAIALALVLALAGSVRAEPPAAGLTALKRLRAPAHVWWRDWAGWALAATGGFALLFGAIDLGFTEPRWAEANQTWQKFADARDTPGRMAADITMLTLGAGVIACSVVRFVLVARRADADRARFSLAPRGVLVRF